MNAERYKELEIYRELFTKAIESKFIRTISSYHSSQLSKFYKEEFGIDSKIRGGCGACVLREVTKLGNAFFNYEQKMKEEQVIENITEEPVEEVINLNLGENAPNIDLKEYNEVPVVNETKVENKAKRKPRTNKNNKK